MDADTVQKIADMAVDAARSALVTVDGKAFSLRKLHLPPLAPVPSPDCIEVSTLKGFVDAAKKVVAEGEGDIWAEPLVRVRPGFVGLLGALNGDTGQRFVYVAACTPVGQILGEKISRPFQQDEFAIWLTTAFADDLERQRLLMIASAIATDRGATLEDDGVTQRVATKAGVRLVTTTTIVNPFLLRPYRTFPEIAAPADLPWSTFIFRVQEAPNGQLALFLHEVDNGAWALAATAMVADYLRALLPETWTIVG